MVGKAVVEVRILPCRISLAVHDVSIDGQSEERGRQHTSAASTTNLGRDLVSRKRPKASCEHAHDRVHAITVALPHGAELGLASDVPYLEYDVSTPDLPEVEGDGRDDVLAPLRSRSVHTARGRGMLGS